MPTTYDSVTGIPNYTMPGMEDAPLDPTGGQPADESKFDRIEKMLIGLADKVDRIEKFLDARPKLFGNDGTAEVSGAISGSISGSDASGAG